MTYFGVQIEVVGDQKSFIGLIHSLSKYKKNLVISNTPDTFFDNKKTPLHRDQSLTPRDLFDYSFEVKTVKMVYCEESLQILYKILNEIYKHCYSNENCSIHVHVSKARHSLKKHYAILYKYLEEKLDKQLLYYKGVKLHNETYADYKSSRNKYFYLINSKTRESNSKYIVKLQNDNRKSTLYRISHDYNTIEYRGIRGHIEHLSQQDVIFLINKFISTIEKIKCDKKTLEKFEVQ